MEYAGCNPSAALGDFKCPTNEELSPLARRFFPFPRFPVPKDPQLYIICVDGVPRLNTCAEGSLFSEVFLLSIITFSCIFFSGISGLRGTVLKLYYCIETRALLYYYQI